MAVSRPIGIGSAGEQSLDQALIQILRIFLQSEGRTKWTVLISLFVASLAEGVGLASMLPALTLVLDEPGTDPSLIHRMVDDALAAIGLPATIEVLLLVLVAGVLIKAALMVLCMIHVSYAVADVATNLRTRLLRSLLDVRWAYFTRQPVGRFANAMSVDATHAGETYLLAMMMMASMLQAIVNVALAFLMSWKLALLGFGLGMVIILILGPLVRVSKRAGRRRQSSQQKLVSLLSDALTGIKPLKAMARQDQFLPLFGRQIRSLRHALRRQAVSGQVMTALRPPIFTVFAVVGFYIVYTRFEIPLSQLAIMALLLERTVSAMGRVQNQLQRAVVQESAHRAVGRLIAEAEAEREEFTGTQPPTLEHGCRFEHLSFAFGDKLILDDVSLEIPANRLTVIMGLSGVGKTTITDLLLGLYQPSLGRILIDGVPLAMIDHEAWRSMVGYVPQELLLFHDSVLANVTLGDPAITSEQVIEALETAGAWPFVAALPDGLMSSVGERGTQLSGGQRQRIALARALVTRPRLLILDEVTSALDPRTETEICENVRALDGQMTILAITHRSAWVDVADQLYQLDPDGIRRVTGHRPEPAALHA